MRVCIVVSYDLDEDGGGVKHHALHLARALRQGGDQVTVVGPSTVARNTPEIVGFRGVINVVSNGSDNRLGIFVSPLSVRRFFQRNRFDAIHRGQWRRGGGFVHSTTTASSDTTAALS